VARRKRISTAKKPFLDAILEVLQAQKRFWPLTDRGIHYGLLNAPPLIHAAKPESRYGNNQKSYRALCELLTRARLAGAISFDVICDPTRPVEAWGFFREVTPFIRQEMNGFAKGYYRDLQQSQPNHIEIVGEKNTILNVVRPVAMEYCIPFTIGRGYCSLQPRREIFERFRKSGKEKLVLFLLSDFDPDGENIVHSFARSLRDDFGIQQIKPIKVALTKKQVDELSLPPALKAKKSSSSYRKFSQRYGDNAYELESIPPETLQAILQEAIDSVLDVDAFNVEVRKEKDDATELDGMRRQVVQFIREITLDRNGQEEDDD
jgi:hypothetical protein